MPCLFAESVHTRLTAQEVAIANSPSVNASVTAALVWTPGQQEAEAIFAEGPDPSAIAATFVGLVPNDAPADNIRFMEDGFFVLLSARSASELAAGLRARSSIQLTDGARARTVAPASAG